MPNLDNLSFDYQQLQELGIIVGIIIAISTTLFATVKRIYCKGKNDTILNERITLLENWKEQHNREYIKLQEVNDEVRDVLSDVGKKIAYLTGLLEGNGTKE